MPEFDIVFEKLQLALAEEANQGPPDQRDAHLVSSELDEIEELRRFAAEMQEPEPTSYTIT